MKGQKGSVLSCFIEPCLFPYRESIVSLKRKYLRSETEEGVSLTQPSMDGILDTIAQEGCSSLLEEVFLDLEVGAGSLLLCFQAENHVSVQRGSVTHPVTAPCDPDGADIPVHLSPYERAFAFL